MTNIIKVKVFPVNSWSAGCATSSSSTPRVEARDPLECPSCTWDGINITDSSFISQIHQVSDMGITTTEFINVSNVDADTEKFVTL